MAACVCNRALLTFGSWTGILCPVHGSTYTGMPQLWQDDGDNT